MADAINEGFGQSAPVVLNGATTDILCRYIQAPPNGFVRIRAINPMVAQIDGAVALTSAIPIFVLRGTANLGIGAGGNLVIPLRPAGSILPGLPDISQLAGGIELLLATYINSRSSNGLLFPQDEENHVDLIARDTQKLAVCVGPLVNLGNAPAVIVAQLHGATLSVLGSMGVLSEKTQAPGRLGVVESLPRYDISHDEELVAHPSSK